jgi:competence protein ComEC
MFRTAIFPQQFYINSLLFIAGLTAGLLQHEALIIGLIAVLVLVISVQKLLSSEYPLMRHGVLTATLTVCALLYGYWTEESSQTQIPEAWEHEEIIVQGTIVSAVKVDGDRVSMQLYVDRIYAASHLIEQDVLVEPDAGGLTRSMSDADEAIRSVIREEQIMLEPDERLQVVIYLDREEQQQTVLTWIRGMELRLQGTLGHPGTARNFGDFDYRAFLEKQRIYWQLTVDDLDAAVVRSRPSLSAHLLLGYMDRISDRMTELVWRLYDERYAGFMQGLLIGDRQELQPELYNRFSDIGMTHVLAISGLHVSVFTAGCFWLLRIFRMTRERAIIICFILVPLYVLFTGASPSAIRAGLMGMLGLLAMRLGRWRDSLRYILIAALAMLVANPYYIYNVSFQLSFLVTAGLILLVPQLVHAMHRLPSAISGALAVTIAAQLFSYPIVIYYFHILHLLSPIANLLLVPLVSVIILPLGMLSLLFGVVHPVLGHLLAWPNSYVVELLFRAVTWTAEREALLTIWPQVPVWWAAAYYVLLLAIICLYPRLRDWGSRPALRGLLLLAPASMTALILYAYAGDPWERTGIVSVLDVGQGDSILIRTPSGKHILVDGGGTFNYAREDEAWRSRRDPYEVGKDTIVPLLRRRGVRQLDAVIATHLDADHIGGLHAVIEQVPTARILFNGTLKDSPYAERLIASALERDIPIIPVTSGHKWQVDGVTNLTFLHPFTSLEGIEEYGLQEADDQNGESVVFLLQMDEASFLFTGDIGEAEERAILRSLQSEESEALGSGSAENAVAPIDVLKVAHHGSRYSTSGAWLDYWQPLIGVISVGRNFYGHPTDDVLERLAEREIIVYRTDQHGEVQYRIVNGRLEMRTKLAP